MQPDQTNATILNEPEPHSLQRFKFKAVIDWIELRVRLEHPSQFRHVQARMLDLWGKVYFVAEEGAASSRVFKFKLNDPPCPSQFMLDLQWMATPLQAAIPEHDVSITGIEIALDAYIPGSDRVALAEAVCYFLWHQANPPKGAPRITARQCSPVCPGTTTEVIAALLGGNVTVNSGALTDEHRSRFYLKDYDSVDGVSYASIPSEQWRARFENIFTGSAMPFTTIAGWRSCAFEKVLASRFALVRSVAPADSLASGMQSKVLQLGRRPDSPKRRPSDRRKRRPFTRRDSVVNDRIRQALRRLTYSQSGQNSGSLKFSA